MGVVLNRSQSGGRADRRENLAYGSSIAPYLDGGVISAGPKPPRGLIDGRCPPGYAVAKTRYLTVCAPAVLPKNITFSLNNRPNRGYRRLVPGPEKRTFLQRCSVGGQARAMSCAGDTLFLRNLSMPPGAPLSGKTKDGAHL